VSSRREPDNVDLAVSREQGPTSDSPPDIDPDPQLLPAAVRVRVLALAAEALGALPAEDLPSGLRTFARFTPARRAKLAAVPLATALEADEGFREAVGARLREALPDLAAALETGRALSAVPPEDLATAAYLLRPEGWERTLARAAEALADAGEAESVRRAETRVEELRAELERARAAARDEAARLTAEAGAVRSELEALRRQRRDEVGESRRARSDAAAALSAVQAERDEARKAVLAAEAESRRLRARANDAEVALEAARRARREGRDEQDLRLRVLLHTLIGSATGLRRELALAPLEEQRPADAVAEALSSLEEAGSAAPGTARALPADDPGLLSELLSVPGCHLLVDGYNVTKTAYGDLSLQDQRSRLLSGLGALASRTGAEVTCVFDGVERATPLALAAPRGVRLLFSTTADETLRQLARAEPPGRPVVVVSSDREVADGVRGAGARSVASAALLRLLERS
jgi:hypothetical protein